MARFRWLIWGAFFSTVLFFSIYLLIYQKVNNSFGPVVLMLGNLNVSRLGDFFSNIRNVIITSLIGGFLLGLIAGIGSKTRE